MGCLYFFDEAIALDDEPRVRCTAQQVEVSIPELVIGPVGAAHEGLRATFNDWQQFVRFVNSVNDLKNRLSGIHT